jgi:hypothetical protein
MGWANKLIGWTSNNGAEVNSKGSVHMVKVAPTGANYSVAAKTGTIAAAAAAGAAVFAMRLDPSYSGKAWIDSIRIRWTTIVAFTVPISQTRSLVITRGSGAETGGGTLIAANTKKYASYPASQYDTAEGGDVRISTTGALTVTGVVWEATNLAEMTLAQVGTAGAFYEAIYEFSVRNHEIELTAGQVLGIRVGSSAMEAAGTWSLGVEVNWRESLTEA